MPSYIAQMFMICVLIVSVNAQYVHFPTRNVQTLPVTTTINNEPLGVPIPPSFLMTSKTPDVIMIGATYYDYLIDFKHYMTSLLIITPMKNLYLNGPKSAFCWGGDELPDICGRISGTSSEFWNKNMPECVAMIDKQFNSLYIMLMTIIYVIVVYKVVTMLWWRFFVMRPMMNHMNTILEPLLLTLANK
jgi:hypothetical protein